ncbi:hypothetical protein KVV02_004046 [Mortierella alpina]|uniref:Uncharacterized protein n=1 Tax=Mortierella alpina TaxID=64518 RepID=A0A9P8ABU0_MORAP|nr:hypothetical protein KVV02_004046 [Mortierella alpina]
MDKNDQGATFANSLRAFVDLTQDPLEQQTSGDQSPYVLLREEYKRLVGQYAKNQNEMLEMKRSSKPPERRHKSSQTFNRHRPVGPPRQPQHVKMYKWKPHVPKTANNAAKVANESSSSSSKVKKARKARAKTASAKELKRNMSDKTKVLCMMDRQHPISTLNIGTARANIRGAVGNGPDLENAILQGLQEVCGYAAKAKRSCQILVGVFIEKVTGQDGVSEADRALLDFICPRHAEAGEEGPEGCAGADDDDNQALDQVEFLRVLLQHLYSGKCNCSTKFGRAVKSFIERAHALGICPAWNSASASSTHNLSYPAGPLLKPIAKELAREYKRHWIAGTDLLSEKLQEMKNEGHLQDYPKICADRSSIENFARLNRLQKNPWRIAPLTSSAQPFFEFTELQLLHFFWKWPMLQREIRVLLGPRNYTPALHDAKRSLSMQPPGTLSTRFLTPVGRGRTRKGPRNYREATRTMGIDELQAHLEVLRHNDFNVTHYMDCFNSNSSPKPYPYVLRGFVRTDGFRLQVLAYKLKELQAARYKRLPDERLPPRINSTVAVVDYYLSEMRNVIKTPQDVARLFDGCPPDKIKSEKEKVPEVISQSITDIESAMPPLRGHQGSMEKYAAELEQVQTVLDGFYRDDQRFKKHEWDHSKAKEGEYAIITDRLLKMVGGAIGEKRKPDNPVIIAIGLGDFTSTSGFTSLHGSFRDFFVQKVRSLGYVDVGINEFYSSKKCPCCPKFVG